MEQLEEAFDYIDRYNRTRAEFSRLDHYYQEPYQDEDDEIKEMGKSIETDESKKIRSLDLVNEDRTDSGFSYFMDGSRRTYKIGDMVLEGKKIYPVVVAQVRAGCTEKDRQKKLHPDDTIMTRQHAAVLDQEWIEWKK